MIIGLGYKQEFDLAEKIVHSTSTLKLVWEGKGADEMREAVNAGYQPSLIPLEGLSVNLVLGTILYNLVKHVSKKCNELPNSCLSLIETGKNAGLGLELRLLTSRISLLLDDRVSDNISVKAK